MIVTKPRRRTSKATAQAGPDPERAIRDYMRAYVWRHGRRKTAEVLGVSRHTLWRFLERGHMGQAVPSAVLSSVGGNVRAIENARQQLLIDLMGLRPDPALRPLREGLKEALLLLCAAPLTTVDELSRLGRVPASTLRERLEKLVKRGLVDSVPHHLSILGTRPQRRYFPTEKGIIAGGVATKGRAHMLHVYPVSKQWFRLLAERLDAVAVLYRVAAMVADSDPHNDPMRVDRYRRGPYDMLLTLSGGRSIGLLRQGPMLSTANLRYRLRSIERLDSSERPFVTLVLTHANQATRRAIRSLGDPSEHRRTFVATEGELLAGDHNGVVWQQCGSGLGDDPPVQVSPDASLTGILAWAERLLDSSYSFLRDNPKPNPGNLYPSGVQASMSEPSQQLASALGVQLTRADRDALDLTPIASDYLQESRTGRNIRHHLVPLLRQSIYSRLAGYDDTNDAERLSQDPAMRVVVGWQGSDRNAARTNTMSRFETETLTQEDNLKGLALMNPQWVELAMAHTPHRRVILDMDSSESPVHGQQEGAAYNGHFECVCYHPLFLFNQFGDCEGATLRPGNVHSADGWQELLEPVVKGYQKKGLRLLFRGDAAFAKPELYEYLEQGKIGYAIRLPANQVIQEQIQPLLERPTEWPSREPIVSYHDFAYQAQSWHLPRRVVAKVEWHQGELFPRVGFIVTNLSYPPKGIVRFYNGRGTAEQWIKEGKYALNWTRLSCHKFVANQMRLWLFVLTYNLGNFMRRLVLPEDMKHWTLTSLQTRLIKTGGRLVRHARRLVFQLAEVLVTREMLTGILERISRLRLAPG